MKISEKALHLIGRDVMGSREELTDGKGVHRPSKPMRIWTLEGPVPEPEIGEGEPDSADNVVPFPGLPKSA